MKFNEGLSGPFDESVVQFIWEKAHPIPGREGRRSTIRQDKYGREIHRHRFGNIRSKFGWEIDHCTPLAHPHYGTDHLNNLQPLHWIENRVKGNRHPYSKPVRDRAWRAWENNTV